MIFAAALQAWKNGKRKAEKDEFVGSMFFKLISQDVPCPNDSCVKSGESVCACVCLFVSECVCERERGRACACVSVSVSMSVSVSVTQAQAHATFLFAAADSDRDKEIEQFEKFVAAMNKAVKVCCMLRAAKSNGNEAADRWTDRFSDKQTHTYTQGHSRARTHACTYARTQHPSSPPPHNPWLQRNVDVAARFSDRMASTFKGEYGRVSSALDLLGKTFSQSGGQVNGGAYGRAREREGGGRGKRRHKTDVLYS